MLAYVLSHIIKGSSKVLSFFSSFMTAGLPVSINRNDQKE